MLAATERRVPAHTSEPVNESILREAKARVKACSTDPARIDDRLKKLDKEWDIERTLEANAATLAFVGTLLGFSAHRYFLAIPAVVTGFLFQHALQGWCPPLPVLRRLGFRTAREISDERNALKAVRGEYEGSAGNPELAFQAASS